MTALIPMRPQCYDIYVEAAIVDYANDNIEAGRWPVTGAVERARADFDALLPRGLATPDHFLYEIVTEANETVGFAWLAIDRRCDAVSAYVYDLKIVPEARRRGHATRALQGLESIAASVGAAGIALNVFSGNHAAQALYRSLGYIPTNVNMLKPLPS